MVSSSSAVGRGGGGPLTVTACETIPIIGPGDDVSSIIGAALAREGLHPCDGDVLVVAHKILSVAEGGVIALAGVQPSREAQDLSARTGKDARVVELMLRESTAISRVRPGLLITHHRLGFVCANAGVDQSNAGAGNAVLLPRDPDNWARALREALRRRFGVAVAVIVADTHGRAHRQAAIGVCIGLAGGAAVRDQRGRTDLFGYEMQSSMEALADELAGAATILMGQTDERRPVALIRGTPLDPGDDGAAALLRPPSRDLFS
ncbi:MAG: coenzyme F420-0:L-glutamate ligase [Armatimonadetes bacterium]|nr:coenzyme F420-0:L-glutamate ligase [Armatimonadota bacterium]